jgi:arylsulfatase A-like enzyme
MKIFCLKHSLLVLAALSLFNFTARADDDATNSFASIFTNIHAQAAIPRRASIIFIQCHDLGYGDLSCYGQTNFQTPNLDKLAAEGIRFNYYSPGDTNVANVQTAFMNGKISTADGISVAQVLKNAGYATAILGEWPLASKPWLQGFDEFAGFFGDEGTNYYADYLWRFEPTSIYGQSVGHEMIYDNTGGRKGKYMPDFLLITAVQNYVRAHQPDRFNHYRPFFLLVNLPAPRSAALDKDEFPVPSDAPYSEEPWPQAAKNRAALITRIDGDIGRLVEKLDKLGMTNNVAIFFTSSSAPKRFADEKLNFFRVPADVQRNWSAPMIVRWPGKIPAGQVSDFNWSPADFLPMAAEIGFAKLPEKIDGKSILPVLAGEKSSQ